MIHDARVEVTCDAQGCTESIQIEPEYVYRRTYNENSGYYDTRDKSIHNKLRDEGWAVVDEKTFCKAHAPEDSDTDDEEDED